MGPRGYAVTDCNTFTSPMKLGFQAGTESQAVELLPMGQLILP